MPASEFGHPTHAEDRPSPELPKGGGPSSVGWTGYAVAALILFTMGFVLTSSMLAQLPGVSPIDEWAYIDSLEKGSRFQLPRPGQRIGSYAREVISCRGVIGVGQVGNPCGEPQPDEAYPLGAVSPAPIHPPTYFVISGVTARVMVKASVTDDLVNAGRLVGAMWVVVGGIALVTAGSYWGVRWWTVTAAASSMIFLPVAAASLGFITPDASFLFASSLPLLGVTLWLRRAMSVRWLLVWGGLPVLLKTTHVPATLGVCVVLLVAASAVPQHRRRFIRGAVTLAVGAAVALVAWRLALGAIAIGEIPSHPDQFSSSSALGMIGYSYTATLTTSGAPIPLPDQSSMIGSIYLALVGASALGSILYGRGLTQILGVGSAIMALFTQLMMSTLVLLSGGAFIRAAPRYSLAAIPLMIAPLLFARRQLMVTAIFGVTALLGATGFAVWALGS